MTIAAAYTRLIHLARTTLLFAALLTFFSLSVRAQTPVFFGSVNVGANSNATVTLQFVNGGTVSGTPPVLTQGISGLDFLTVNTGTCITNGSPHTYAAGATCTLNVKFKPARPGLRLGAAQMLDSSGNILAQTYISGIGVGPQVTFVNEVLGVYQPGSQLPINGFTVPSNVAVDADENVYGTDFDLGIVVEATAASNYQTLTTLGGGFNAPQSLVLDGAGNIYVANQNSNLLQEIPPGCATSSCVITLPGTYTGAAGVAVDGAGNVYLVGTDGNIHEFQTNGTILLLGTVDNSTNGIPDIALDSNNNLFVIVTNQTNVIEYLASTNYTTTKTINSGFSGGNLFIGGIALDALGNIFLPEVVSNTVHEIPAAGGYNSVITLATGLSQPNGIAVDARGNVYVCNGGANNIIRLDYTDAPTLTFESTPAGHTSADSPQTLTFINDGNANLTFTVPATGTNPSITSAYSLDTSITNACPQLTSSSTPATLKPGSDCLLPVSFTPPVAGTYDGQLVITDNALNAGAPNYAQQVVNLTGIGINTHTITSLTATPNPVFLNNSVTITVNVTPVAAAAGTPVGDITIKDGAATLASGMLDSNGTFILTLSNFTAGNHQLTALYAGTSFFLPSSSGNYTLQIVDFTLAVKSTTLTVTPGKYAIYNLTITPNSPATTLPAEIQLTQSGIPVDSSFSFSPATISSGSGAVSFTFKVSAPIGFARNSSTSPITLCALLLLPLSLRLIRKTSRTLRRLSLIFIILGSLTASLAFTGCGSYIRPGTYTIHITATSGNLVHTTDLTLNFI
jgi:streptogramin lyase